MTYGSLFSGVGGIDLGLDRAGMECRWMVMPTCKTDLERQSSRTSLVPQREFPIACGVGGDAILCRGIGYWGHCSICLSLGDGQPPLVPSGAPIFFLPLRYAQRNRGWPCLVAVRGSFCIPIDLRTLRRSSLHGPSRWLSVRAAGSTPIFDGDIEGSGKSLRGLWRCASGSPRYLAFVLFLPLRTRLNWSAWQNYA